MWRSSRELGGWVGCMGGTNRGKQSKNFPHLLARKRETKNRLSYTYFFFGCLCFILFALQCHKFVDVCLTLRGERGVKGGGRCTKGVEYRWEAGGKVTVTVRVTILLRLVKWSWKLKDGQSHSVNAFRNECMMQVVVAGITKGFPSKRLANEQWTLTGGDTCWRSIISLSHQADRWFQVIQ